MKSKLNICHEWFFSGKKEDKVEFDFLLYPEDDLSDIKYGKISNENILDILGEDNKDGLVQQLCNYTDWYLEQAVDDFESTKKRLWDEYNETKYNLKRAEKELSNPKCKCSPYQIPMSALTLLNGNQTKESIFWNWKDIEEQTKGLTDPNQKKIVAEMFKAINLVVNEYNRICKKIMAKGKVIKYGVEQEGLFDMFKKKEENKPVSRWNFYTLFIYVKFYNKNFINLYKKAGKEYADIVKKMVAKYYKYKDYNVPGYDKVRAEFEKEVKGLCEKLLVSNKPLFEKTRNILKGVCDGIDNVKYPLAASTWVNDGKYNPESKGQTHLSVYALSEIGTDSDIYSVWGEEFKTNIKFKTISATTQKVILNQLLKEVKDVVEPDTDIYVPTGNYVEAYDSGKYGDYEDGIPNDIVPNMLYGIDDQGEYLPAPDVDKSELEAAIQQCLDTLNVSQEEYSVATEMTFGENLKSTFNLSGDRGTVNVDVKDKNSIHVINTIKNEIMPGLFGAYNEVRKQIADKFYGRLPNDAYTYIKEMEKRQLKLKELTSNVTGEMSDKDLEKAKKGLVSIKKVKYDEIPHKTYEWTNNIHLMAKYEYEIGGRCEIIDIMLIVKFLREHTYSYIKNHSGATYHKILKDLKEWMNKNVTITYEQDGNIIKTVKI